MSLHRNSQKRFYLEDHVYFVTGVTQNRVGYFEEEVFCEVFLENLKICKELKDFELHGWFLGFDHFHMLVTPGEANISEIMRSFKTNVSRDMNRIMEQTVDDRFFEGEVSRPRLQKTGYDEYWNMIDFHNQKLKSLNSQFHQKYPKPYLIPFPKFKWQRSFYDHVIRDEQDFETHMKYIEYNLIKHGMPEGWGWIGVNFKE